MMNERARTRGCAGACSRRRTSAFSGGKKFRPRDDPVCHTRARRELHCSLQLLSQRELAGYHPALSTHCRGWDIYPVVVGSVSRRWLRVRDIRDVREKVARQCTQTQSLTGSAHGAFATRGVFGRWTKPRVATTRVFGQEEVTLAHFAQRQFIHANPHRHVLCKPTEPQSQAV